MDVDAGRVVKGTRFIDIRDAGDPVELAAFYDREGADELIFLDITATSDKRATVVELARRAADEVFVPFTIGGGVREVADAQAVLDAGADKVAVNSAAVARPGARGRARGGARRPVRGARDRRQAARDDGWEVFVAGGRTATGRDAVDWAREGVAARGGGDPADLDGPRRHAGRLRPRADARGRGRGRRARDRVGRRRRARAHGRRASRPAPTRCSRRRSSTTAATRSPRSRRSWTPPACRCASAARAVRAFTQRW